MEKKIILLVLWPFAVYLFLCVLLYAGQDKFLYKPRVEESRLAELQQKYPHLQEVTYLLPSGKQLYAWFQKPGKKGKIVLFAHGNSYNLNYVTSKITPWIDAGYGVLAVEYEGFGKLPGKPSQAALERAGQTAVKWLNGQGYQNKDIILYGHSMGTYVATFLAAEMGQEKPFDAVVLESPFLSLVEAADVGARRMFFVPFPVGILIKDKYPTDELIQKINTRLFVGHGKLDKTIPYAQGVALFNKALKEKAFFSSDKAEHHTLTEHGFFEAVWKWL